MQLSPGTGGGGACDSERRDGVVFRKKVECLAASSTTGSSLGSGIGRGLDFEDEPADSGAVVVIRGLWRRESAQGWWSDIFGNGDDDNTGKEDFFCRGRQYASRLVPFWSNLSVVVRSLELFLSTLPCSFVPSPSFSFERLTLI